MNLLSNSGIEIAGLGCGIADITVQPSIAGGQQMRVTLENGYELSILAGGFGVYTKGGTFEVATIVKGGGIDDVLGDSGDGIYGYQTHSEVADILKRVSRLPNAGNALKA